PKVEFDTSIPAIPKENLFLRSPLPPPPDITTTPTPGIFRAKLDSEPTEWMEHMEHKTTWRDHYISARERTCNDLVKEVILYDRDDEILEGSFTNVYFWRNQRWIGMKAGMDGTIRRWLRE